MEYRKLISFGKNSFVVSLPKPWILQNKMVKGDLVYIEENGPTLTLSKKDLGGQREERERVIHVDGKKLSTIEREVNTAYILNCRRIVLKGKDIRKEIKDIQTIIQGLIALEVMEQTPETIVAKDFLNMDKVSMDELVRKMDVVTRTMLRETFVLNQESHEGIAERDKDVNRLYSLLCRAIQYNIENPSKAMKNFKLRAIDLLALQFVGLYVEAIGDEAKRVARYSKTIKVTGAQRKEIEEFMGKVLRYYMESMKSVYNKDVASSLNLSERRKELNKALDDVIDTHKGKLGDPLDRMAGRLRRMISHIHHLGWTTYTTRME